MLTATTMLRRLFLFGVAVSAATLLSSTAARAQTTPTGPTLSRSSGQINPLRLINGSEAASRAQNVNPLGVNYSDCANDMTLRFNVIASNFDGNSLIQVWAGTADCTSNESRGIGSVPSCWLVDQSLAGIVVGASATLPITFDVRVQDLVGHQQSVPSTPVYSRVGSAGCQSQTVDTAQKITVFFVPTDSSGHNPTGAQIYQYPVTTDLVGPPAPTNPSLAVGDTLFVVNWTPNTDADTAGYDVYVDPFPGQEGVSTGSAGPEPTLVCTSAATAEASASAASDATTDSGADATTDSGTDGSVAATTAAEASCVFVQTGGSGTSGSCGSAGLQSTLSTTASGTTTTTSDGGDDSSTTTTTTTGVAGTSNLPGNLLVGGSSGLTVSDKSSGQYTLTGLQNGTTYTVVVAAVDGSGNVGPPSGQVCDSPAPVLDFWSTYRAAGGTAGGGFCALEAVGHPAPAGCAFSLFAGACALGVRRRTRRPTRRRSRAEDPGAERRPNAR